MNTLSCVENLHISTIKAARTNEMGRSDKKLATVTNENEMELEPPPLKQFPAGRINLGQGLGTQLCIQSFTDYIQHTFGLQKASRSYYCHI